MSTEPSAILSRYYSEGVLHSTSDSGIFDWMSEQTSDTWHQIACSWNYDGNNAVIKWIVEQPNCDKGTAVQLFNVDASNWLDTKISELRECYHDAWHCVDIAKRRLLANDFKLAELIPHHDRYQGLKNVSIPQEILSYKGQRKAVSDYVSSDGSIMLTLDAFCQNIGVDNPF